MSTAVRPDGDARAWDGWAGGGGRDLPQGVEVVGGVGGTRALLGSLDAAAGTLQCAAGHLGVAAEHARVVTELVEQASRISPSTGHWARTATAPLTSPTDGLGAQVQELQSLVLGLLGAAQGYAEADRGSGALLRGLSIAVGGIAGGSPLLLAVLSLPLVAHVAAPLVVVGVTAGGLALLGRAPGSMGLGARTALTVGQTVMGRGARAVGAGALTLAERHRPSAQVVEVMVPGMAAMVVSLQPGPQLNGTNPVPVAARALASTLGVASAVTTGPTQLVVSPVVQTPASGRAGGAPAPVRSASDALGRVTVTYPGAGGPPGTVEIQRLDHPDGTRAWSVAIPGTQEWGPGGGPNPLDLTTNLRLMAGLPDDGSALVLEAMAQAGVGPDEKVVLTGHSQGGMVAMQLASDPSVRDRYTIDTVITAGSPVGHVEVPPETQVMNLQHEEDPVHAIDGVPSPDERNRTTVVRKLASSSDPAERMLALSASASHSCAAYERSGELYENAAHPSLAAQHARLAEVLGGAGTTAVTQQFTGVRVPVEGSGGSTGRASGAAEVSRGPVPPG
ncbi:GPI inositol-deacylase [Actinotalea sp. K2]|uniref:GPI inositol-deacylase n=1 Tax=Actinotalea sp. K2 TaxID=2939438 RepID=UPI00201733B8|nr:GPI inositol-deacylase [Actinotalea sp. K2]MCL3861656.1 GPI inositol-deacylase [Actinotalea sp. K2]